jgi:hypothetical protein
MTEFERGFLSGVVITVFACVSVILLAHYLYQGV